MKSLKIKETNNLESGERKIQVTDSRNATRTWGPPPNASHTDKVTELSRIVLITDIPEATESFDVVIARFANSLNRSQDRKEFAWKYL